MMKIKQYALLLAGMTLISLAGCGKQEPPLTITGNPSSVGISADVSSVTEASDDIPVSPSAPAESENPTDSIPETRLQAEETESPAKPSGTEYAAESKQPAQTEEKTNSISSTPPKESETQKPNPAPTQSSAEEPSQSEPPQETAPPEEPTVPDFNIQTWIDYAKTYAVSVGLRLESSAVDCWDNPITAGAHSSYLKRDIESRLNRYSRDEDITDVWIWAEERSDGSYDLYIGYA